jgi:predicted transcriptional regulator
VPQDQYYTVKEVAERLKVAEATVRHRIKGSSSVRSTLARAGASTIAIWPASCSSTRPR